MEHLSSWIESRSSLLSPFRVNVRLGITATFSALEPISSLTETKEPPPTLLVGAYEPPNPKLLVPGECSIAPIATPAVPAAGHWLGLEHIPPPVVVTDATGKLAQFTRPCGVFGVMLFQGLDSEGSAGL